jgi:hypothetical protein
VPKPYLASGTYLRDQVASMGDVKNVYSILVGKRGGKRALGKKQM